MIEKVNNHGNEHDERDANREKEVNYHLCAFANISRIQRTQQNNVSMYNNRTFEE